MQQSIIPLLSLPHILSDIFGPIRFNRVGLRIKNIGAPGGLVYGSSFPGLQNKLSHLIPGIATQ